ncbi:helix-turn-helix domain-containing protein [Actinomadura macra]|uniref:helix-turn-helix domain-containing protein n=1 Tax=Actinomadura macra TaxID=46164 RepID=UPI0008373801|nr:helix-turn-helix transcriptional regulator [Actinomadura macra]
MQHPTRKRPKDPLDHEPKAVQYARSQSGLTQQQVADRCGVSKSLITEIENGTRNATPSMLNRLAEALNCPRVVLERKREVISCPTPARQPMVECPNCGAANDPARGSTRCYACNLPLSGTGGDA